jgi:uncharacterized damage-inducible protein DinB
MFTSVNDFVSTWKYESESMLRYIDELTDDALTVKVHPQVRSAGVLTWHIIHTVSEMMNKTGLHVAGKEQQDYAGETVAELHNAWVLSSDSLIEQLTTHWTDADLQKEDNMYGQPWKRGTTLHILITHMAHHRGQLSVIMRMQGKKVHGIYGPAYEEWAEFGAQPMM